MRLKVKWQNRMWNTNATHFIMGSSDVCLDEHGWKLVLSTKFFFSLHRTPLYRFYCSNTKKSNEKWACPDEKYNKEIHCRKFTWSFDYIGYFFRLHLHFHALKSINFLAYSTCLLLTIQSWTKLTLNNGHSSIEAVINVLLMTKAAAVAIVAVITKP